MLGLAEGGLTMPVLEARGEDTLAGGEGTVGGRELEGTVGVLEAEVAVGVLEKGVTRKAVLMTLVDTTIVSGFPQLGGPPQCAAKGAAPTTDAMTRGKRSVGLTIMTDQ